MTLKTRAEPVSIEDWNSNGWALVPAFLGPEEVAALRREAERLCAARELFDRRGSIPNSTTRSDRLDPVIDLSEPFESVARHSRLHSLVSEVLGGEAQLLKDKFIAKPPGAIGYGAHQDGAYWPGLGVDPNRFLTAVIFLDDSTAHKGAIECVSGYHHKLLTDPAVIADPDEGSLGAFTTVEARAGDLLLLHALTPHRSGPNRSVEMRRALLYTYGIDPRPDLYRLYQDHRSAIARSTPPSTPPSGDLSDRAIGLPGRPRVSG